MGHRRLLRMCEHAIGQPTAATASLREKAETLAGLLSVGSLGPDESEIGVNVIFDLLAEIERLRRELATRLPNQYVMNRRAER